MAHSPHRTIRWALLIAGAVLLLVGVLWRPVVVPRLVKFPTTLDQTTTYEGTFVVAVNPGTGATLPSPVDLPLQLERRILTVPEQSNADAVVVQELVTFRIAGTEQRESHQYVMDRRTMANRSDPRSYAYEPANVVDRSGTYRVNLPLGARPDGDYRIWENEPGQAFSMVGASRVTDRDGVSLDEMQEVFRSAPVADYYRNELRKQGFALEIGFDELATRLRATGVDVDSALAALPASDAATVAAARTASFPLRFFRDNDGHALIEPRTGAIVDLVGSVEGITATVDLAPLASLREALTRNTSQPAVAALAKGLDDTAAAAPSPVYHLDYHQRPDSVTQIADLTKTELGKLDWIEVRVPVILAAAGIVLLAAGAIRRRPKAAPEARPRSAGRAARYPPWSPPAPHET